MKPVRQAARLNRRRALASERGEALVAAGANVEPSAVIARGAHETIRAGLRGQVAEVLPERGAVITGAATVIAGVVGFGAEAFGPIAFAQAATNQQQGALLVVPTELTQAQYETARANGVAGIIAASAKPGLIGTIAGAPYSALLDGSQRAAMPIPLLLVHGFGAAPLRGEIMQALGAYYRQPAWLNPATDIHTGLRPELVIPLTSPTSGAADERATLEPGAVVWITAGRYTGQAGKLLRVMGARQTLPSGIRARAAVVALESGQEAIIPLAHLIVAG